MYHQLINPGTDPEKQFITVANGYSTAALTVGQVVIFEPDGVSVTIPATASLPNVAGVVAQTIAVGGVGQVQRYGYCANCLVVGTTDVVIGDQLIAVNAAFSVAKASATGLNDANVPFLVALQAYTTTAAAAKKVFIRA